ncbi:MAG: SAM-dependent methyltransferase [Lachnospiraceae bacterium]|nr:SAM-dependent methyltransferase [Lachnospiraceae bacterium]
MNSIKISKRLEKVATCVKKGNRVADIGCDHAYTAIYMIKNNIADKVIAMDINKGPLQKATKNIKEYGCTTQIDTRLSDGAKKLEAGEVDTILISGMGGRLTNKILADSIDVVRQCSQLVLQPQSEIFLVRRFLKKIGFSIIQEDMLIDEGKYYVIINANNDYNSVLDNCDLDGSDIENIEQMNVFDRYGRYLLEHKNSILHQFLTKELDKSNNIKNNLKLKSLEDDRIQTRINELDREIELISEALKYYE